MFHNPPELDLGPWPALEWQQWKDTAKHCNCSRRLWNIPLYVSVHGLSTSAMPIPGGRLLNVGFDFIRHALFIRTSDGVEQSIGLLPRPVADFYADYRNTMQHLGWLVTFHVQMSLAAVRHEQLLYATQLIGREVKSRVNEPLRALAS